jgi:hypothetical protein
MIEILHPIGVVGMHTHRIDAIGHPHRFFRHAT